VSNESQPISDDTGTLWDQLARVGVEIELLAPPGTDRGQVARAIAASVGGSCRPMFGRSTEPTRRGPTRTLYNLSLGTAIHTDDGVELAHVVDDMTIRDGMSSDLSTSGDYRIVTDDKRLAQLISRHADPSAPLDRVLDPVVELFGGELHPNRDRNRWMAFVEGRSLATALLQLEERRRVCEIVTGVISDDHRDRLAALLEPARELGCVVPTEAAVHVHFDAEPFRRADRFAGLVDLFDRRRDELKERFGTNPACRYLGPLPRSLIELCRTPGFRERPWKEVEELTRGIEFQKLLDLNLRNLRYRTRGKDTVEVRILPGSIDPDHIADQVEDLRTILGQLDGPAG
jgi:hypothetical protein